LLNATYGKIDAELNCIGIRARPAAVRVEGCDIDRGDGDKIQSVKTAILDR